MLSLSLVMYTRQARAADAPTPANLMQADTLPANFAGDDPGHVRDALSGRPSAGRSPSITNRVRTFLAHPLQPFRKAGQSASASATQANAQARAERSFVFVIPASHGVRFETKKKLLSVDISLAAPAQPSAILLRETVKGQSGRKLVVAPEAKAKGFIQNIDVIQLDMDGDAKTNVRGRAVLTNFDEAHRDGDFALVLFCTLEPPYLTDRVEHSDPSEEEPTDITRRTSTLRGSVDAVWLIDRKTDTIVTKRLRLVK